jgi:penicillin-binding protein 1A
LASTHALPRRTGRKHAQNAGTKRQKAKRHFLLRFWWLWAVPLAGGAILFGALSYVYAQLPLNLDVTEAQTSFLYDLDGRLLTTLEQGIDRRELKFREMPEVLRNAVIAAEDSQFYTHEGVDLVAIIRAAWANFTGGEIAQGASTITQQYVRNVYPEVGKEVTIQREKHEILRRYLNTVYFGEGAYGVEAASQLYFGENAEDLDLAQAATLAGLISGPELYDPIDNRKLAEGRREYVLGRMTALGMITEEEAVEAGSERIETVGARRTYERSPAAYFIDWSRRYLQKEYGRDLYTSGYRITSSLNREWQEKALAAVQANLSLEPGTPQGALVAIDVQTGEVRAMVGGSNFVRDQTNLATGDGGTGRQSGSSFKPFTLQAAIEEGISLNSMFNGPGTVDLSEKGCPGWKPANYSDSGAGYMNLVSATANSVNTIYAQLVVEVGPESVADMAHQMGIRSPLEIEGGAVPCSITLGTMEVTPLEMTEAYATWASLGVRHQATPVHQIKGPNGKVIRRTDKEGREVFEENDALQAIYAMEQVVCCGTGTVANDGLSYEVFGKTGTTDDDSDVWFCGASSEVAACVWVGHPNGRVSMPGATGGTVAAPIWNDFMVAISGDLDPEPFPEPDLTGEILKASPVPAPSPTGKEEDEEEEEEEEQPSPKPSPSPKPTQPPPPTTPPPTTPPPTTPPPTTPPPRGTGQPRSPP